jgi:hypothetical protein
MKLPFFWGGGKDGVITILRINFRIRNEQIIKGYKYKILQGFLTKFYCFSGFFHLKKNLRLGFLATSRRIPETKSGSTGFVLR